MIQGVIDPREKDLERARREFARACYLIFENTPDGQVIWRHMKADRESISFDVDPYVTAFKEGRRDYVRTIQDAIDFYHSGKESVIVQTERPNEVNK